VKHLETKWLPENLGHLQSIVITCIKIQASMSSLIGDMLMLFGKVTYDAPMEHLKHPTTFALETTH